MKQREFDRELIRLTAIARLVYMLSRGAAFVLLEDRVFWRELWIKLAPVIGWTDKDEAQLRAVADVLKPLIEGLPPKDQLEQIKTVLATGWETAPQSSSVHSAIARLLSRIQSQPHSTPGRS
jgi:hypothetical protein